MASSRLQFFDAPEDAMKFLADLSVREDFLVRVGGEEIQLTGESRVAKMLEMVRTPSVILPKIELYSSHPGGALTAFLGRRTSSELMQSSIDISDREGPSGLPWRRARRQARARCIATDGSVEQPGTGIWHTTKILYTESAEALFRKNYSWYQYPGGPPFRPIPA